MPPSLGGAAGGSFKIKNPHCWGLRMDFQVVRVGEEAGNLGNRSVLRRREGSIGSEGDYFIAIHKSTLGVVQ